MVEQSSKRMPANQKIAQIAAKLVDLLDRAAQCLVWRNQRR